VDRLSTRVKVSRAILYLKLLVHKVILFKDDKQNNFYGNPGTFNSEIHHVASIGRPPVGTAQPGL
jgi:hypothetical protein